MSAISQLHALRDVIQEDVGNRGLRRDPAANLISACADDFAGACHSIAQTPAPVLSIVTGFYIVDAMQILLRERRTGRWGRCFWRGH